MFKLITVIAVVLATIVSSAAAQTIVSPKPSHHHTKSTGYLYFNEARYRTVLVVKKFARREYGTYTIGACHRRGRLAVNCDVSRRRDVDGTTEVCDFISRVRKTVTKRGAGWKTRLDLAGTGCRLG